MKFPYKSLNLLANFVETNATSFFWCYISYGDAMKREETTKVFDEMFDNIKYAKRLLYIKYMDIFDKKK